MCTEGELGMSCLSSLSAGFEFSLRGMATQNWNWFGSCSELQAGALGSGQGGQLRPVVTRPKNPLLDIIGERCQEEDKVFSSMIGTDTLNMQTTSFNMWPKIQYVRRWETSSASKSV